MSKGTKLLYKIEAFDSDYERDRPDKCTAIIGGEQGKAYFNYDYKNHRYLASFISDDFDVYDNIATKEKEIERLNNIINELEKWLNEKKIVWNITREDRDIDYAIVEVLDKLQELKDSDKK